MPKQKVTISTSLGRETKALLDRYCKARGIRINHLIEEAILERIEDDMDCELIDARADEPRVPWKRTG